MSTPANAIQVADTVLKRLAEAGIADAALQPKPEVTIGPLDREAEGPRLNWYLYRISPHPGFRAMEHPGTGTRTALGKPPLALVLHYLLSVYPASLTSTGDQELVAHVTLAAAMRRLHESAIVGAGSPFLPAAAVLVEPLRITLQNLDLEALTKVWTAAAQPLRLSVGYEISLVVVEQQATHRPGPPVGAARALVGPLGTRLLGAAPARLGGDQTTTVRVVGATPDTAYRLAAEAGDPPGAPADGWPMTVAGQDADGVRLRLPRPDLAPGVRRLDAITTVEGIPAGRDSIGLTVVPIVLSIAGTATAGASVTATTAHCAADTEVFLDGRPVTPGAVAATSVTFTVPAATAAGPHTLTLRSRRVAGPAFPFVVAP
ncbi:DUF4255 domain-containing protein [Dactylosporangium roseum]|uniref:DUF4255 domain-containing protein n=1 Tax=Dactylosporangium roseum TaxID=47989 RepID=A0ABY5ZDX4_9ACTN|nr:DUF4255 domain-containing protein [Dactylosporangium roseum]UWZ39150.1 DUF4255 domain-containing protein [Dactylosporangium roseum]